jgi:DNA-binding NtrC family response regulator
MPDNRDDTDDFLNQHLPGDTPGAKALRAGVFRQNKWHRLAAGKLHCSLLTGDTGTGKYRLAKLLVQHDEWSRQGGGEFQSPKVLAAATANLTRVLLTAIPDNLAEAALFGYVKGAFTGADCDRDGVFSDIDVRNVFLDEIGDASLALQGKLLEVIEDRTFRKLGAKPSKRAPKTEARIILATRADLHALVLDGKFREDLYWRIMPFRLHLPPVRERPDEIPVLMNRMIAEHLDPKRLNLTALGLPALPALQAADVEFAKAYPWPGNLRQMSDMLLAWLMHGATVSLREVVESGPQGFEPGSGPGIADIVKARLDDIVAGRRERYGKLGEFWKDIEKEVKEALYHWCVEKNMFDGPQLEFMFKEQKLENIRSGLSNCRSSD